MQEWQSLAHVKWECKYHVVIVTVRFTESRKVLLANTFGHEVTVSAPLAWMKK